ncbi:MAG TPA: hypothetical protein VJ890_08130, partial [Vineibacter sp.]|nr:hypothetical protein [Vineibacter sp.]
MHHRQAWLAMLCGALALASPASAQAQGWIADGRTGCRVWNADPQPNETISWSGTCQSGFAQGRGTLQWFKNDKPSDRYEGEYRDDNQHGRGVYTWADGDRYDGEWQNGEQHGRGVYASADGDRYDGEWQNGEQHGRG